MRNSIALLGLLSCAMFWATGAFGQQPEPTSAESRPNVVLIMTDDQGYGDLGFHGNDKIDTPVLDHLATESVRFDRFFVCPLCTPTRAALLSGRYYPRTGAISVTRGLETMRSEEVTIAEVLKAAGYATGCFGKWHVGEHYPNHPNGQGFDEFFGMPTGHWDNYFDPELEHNGRMVETSGYITDVLTDAAIRFIEEHRDGPFFCYVPYNAPHTPLQVSDELFDKYKARGLDDRAAAIYGMIENIDQNVGRLLNRLDELRLADKTIVLFLSDNGPEGREGSRYNAGMRGMKGTVHEGGVRVPLFVRWPGKLTPGRTVHQIAAHVDLLPTIAELCGVAEPKTLPLDGRSLVPLLRGRADDWPDRMIFHYSVGWRQVVALRDSAIDDVPPYPAAVRTERWRAVNEGSGWQLFDMAADPGQTTDVASRNAKVVDRLGAAHEKWFADVMRLPIVRPPIQVGYDERPAVELPAPEAYPTGKIRWYNKSGFAHDWLTDWTDTADTIWWDVDVVRSGRYQVSLMYVCPPEAVGTKLRVEAAGSAVEGRITKAHNPEPKLRPERRPKNRYTQTFAELKLGQIDLDKGRLRVTVKALSKPADRVCDLKSVWLRRVDQGASRKPNVVLIMTDDQGWGDVHSHGNDMIDTPTMDRIAAQGTRFDRFFVCPMCGPTRASLLTGRYNLRTGASWVSHGLETMRLDEVTIADALAQAGYATGCFGKWHNGEYGPYHPNHRGFQEFVGFCRGAWQNYFDPVLEHNRTPVKTKGYVTDVLTDAVLGFIETNRAHPFFCYVPYNAPHHPFQIPGEYLDKYKGRGFNDKTACVYGMVENIDENLARILGKLDALELTNDTIVIFTSDNGPWLPRYNGHMRGRKAEVDEGGVRVPFFIRWPEHIQPGRTVAQIAAHVDLFPTILELCDVPGPKTLPQDGRSLVPLLSGETADWPDRMIFTHQNRFGETHMTPGSVRTQQYRLVNRGDGYELYDMAADPGQKHDVAGQHPAVTQRLASAYEAWYKEVTSAGVDALPVPVGHPETHVTAIQGEDSSLHGGLEFRGRRGWAHDSILNWKHTDDHVTWHLDVLRPGQYEVTLMYSCPRADVGSRIEIEIGSQCVEATITRAHDPQAPESQPVGRKHVATSGPVWVKTWAPLVLPPVALEKGRTNLIVRALEIPGNEAMVLKEARVRRLDDAPKEKKVMQLRPHHLLDIISEHGQGVEFKPHPYGHAVHTVARTVLSDVETEVEFIVGADEICRPCKHLLPSGQCDDMVRSISPPVSKQKYNDDLDRRLFGYLDFAPGTVMTVRRFLELVDNRLPGIEKICTHPSEEEKQRLEGLIEGLCKLGIRGKR